ncbi:MarR family transcriptional regulator [Actinophytocola oryzae]|uniref:MarR family transcriptional regulator n=2 Tax=Actinophytocola oryzae TaxID=502181 RepID=A0A4R7VSG4_9PSEU|nr:MarR family transcriptional regulator [Actinophytocola oryzae]
MADVNRPLPTGGAASPGNVVAVLRDAGPLTRQQLQTLLGLSRATLVERLDTLQRMRMVRTVGHHASSGGRRAALLEADRSSRVAVVGWLGASHVSIGISDLSGKVLVDHTERLPLGHTPSHVLPWLVDMARQQLSATGRGGDLAAVGLAVPGQIDQATGISIMPTTMPAWRDQPLRDTLADGLGVEVLLENDANALAYGEYLAAGSRQSTVLGVAVGTGIGAGVVIGGRPHRGATGCAGEIGHIRIEDRDERCSCGRRGCVAALASGKALVRQLRGDGVRSLPDVIRRVESGAPQAVAMATDAGRLVGTVLATVVTILNPNLVRVGGEIGSLAPFRAGLAETLTQQAHEVAAQGLDVGPAVLGERAPLVGMAGLAAEAVFDPAAIDRLAARP